MLNYMPNRVYRGAAPRLTRTGYFLCAAPGPSPRYLRKSLLGDSTMVVLEPSVS